MTTLYSFRDDPDVPDFDVSTPIALMDAECAVCSWGARMLHRMDKSGLVRICPIQSPLGNALSRHYGMDPKDPVSWLFLDDGKVYSDSDAIIHAGRRFGGWAGLTVLLLVFPRPLRDWLYQRLARNRYAIFGQADMCALPDPEFQKRIIR